MSEHYFTNNDNLKSELRIIEYEYEGNKFEFYSDNGVFSKNKIDYGSRLLVETVLKENIDYNNFLDVGCGYGYIGITISKIKNVHGDMIDINNRALHLTKRNIERNKVSCNSFNSNGYELVTKKYDMIITNPPIRVGKDILINLLIGAKEHLKINGYLYFVIHKDQGAKSMLKLMKEYYECDVIEKNKGFYIFKAKNIDIAS